MKTEDKVTLPEAMRCLMDALRDDPDYFMSWQANIAMAFVDECSRHPNKPSRTKVHGMANTGAINFLNMLIKTGEPEPDESYFTKDELWQTAGQFPTVNERIEINNSRLDEPEPGLTKAEVHILTNNGGSMNSVIAKARPFNESDIDPSDEVLPDEVEDNEDAKTIAERADQKETKLDLKDL